MTYYDKILSVLPINESVSFSELLEKLNVSKDKSTYVIDGLKKVIKLGTIKMIQVPLEKRLYIGHWYQKNIN
jgi:hypothetical protein